MTVMMDLLAVARATAGRLIGENVEFCGVSTDSRSIGPGELFLALRGDHFDGHDYLAAAKARGAVAAVVAADAADALQELAMPLVQVAETRLSLGALAADWRGRFTLPLIAVTGSNGKTTTKEMIASILKVVYGDAVLVTQGNYNNDIGLPLTLLRLQASHRAAIIEMGMNHPGEIAYLAGIAHPSVAVVTNAQRAHLEGMGSLAAIASEKGSIYSGLGQSGVAVFCADDQWAELWRSQSRGLGVMTFAFDKEADVRGRFHLHGLESRLSVAAGGDEVEIVLSLPGLHNARNALCAATASLAAGADMAAVQVGTERLRRREGRQQIRAGTGRKHHHRRQLQREPGLGSRRHRRAGAGDAGDECWCWATWAKSATKGPQFHGEAGACARAHGIHRTARAGRGKRRSRRTISASGAHHYTDHAAS
jgi:UDP-N-acetylmuramoyl-tripeptide--D-alanyl-D-alanine ligase